jgi:hypothetical protein
MSLLIDAFGAKTVLNVLFVCVLFIYQCFTNCIDYTGSNDALLVNDQNNCSAGCFTTSVSASDDRMTDELEKIQKEAGAA